MIEIILLLFFFMITLSRTGIACCVILLIGGLYKYFKSHKFTVIILLGIGLFLFSQSEYMVYFDMLQDRIFTKSDNVSSATDLRGQLSRQYVSIILDQPEYLFFGLGVGATGHSQELGILVKESHIRDPNTSLF